MDKKVRLLLVEDMKETREAIKTLLPKEFSATEVGSAEEALPIIIGEKPDILLLDIGLPGMSGIELLQLIRGFNTTIKVILMSGSFGDYKTPPSFKRYGVVEFIPKPMGVVELNAALKKAVDSLN